MSNRSSPGPGRDHLAGAGEHVHLEHRLVRQPVAEAGRLDAEAGDRAAEGDRPQLRDDERDQPVRQGRVDEVLVGAHALHLGGRAPRRRPRSRRRARRRRGPGVRGGSRGRNRLDVFFASRTGAPAGSRRTTPAAARTACLVALPRRSPRRLTRRSVTTGVGSQSVPGLPGPDGSGRRRRDRAPRVADVHGHAGAAEVAQRRRGRSGDDLLGVARARPRPRGRVEPDGDRHGDADAERGDLERRQRRRWRRRRCGRRSRGPRRPRRPPVRARVARARVTSFWSSADSSVTDGLLGG